MITIGIHNPTKAREQDFTSDGKAMSSLALIDGQEQAIVYFEGNKIGAAKSMAIVFDAYHGRIDNRPERLGLLEIALAACDDPNAETLLALQNEVKRLISDECCEVCSGLGGKSHADLDGIICESCLDAKSKESQQAHLDAMDDAADHKRQMQREDAK